MDRYLAEINPTFLVHSVVFYFSIWVSQNCLRIAIAMGNTAEHCIWLYPQSGAHDA